jgi:hypothetical protein
MTLERFTQIAFEEGLPPELVAILWHRSSPCDLTDLTDEDVRTAFQRVLRYLRTSAQAIRN